MKFARFGRSFERALQSMSHALWIRSIWKNGYHPWDISQSCWKLFVKFQVRIHSWWWWWDCHRNGSLTNQKALSHWKTMSLENLSRLAGGKSLSHWNVILQINISMLCWWLRWVEAVGHPLVLAWVEWLRKSQGQWQALSWRAQTCFVWSLHTLLAHYLWELSLVHQFLSSLDDGSSFCHQYWWRWLVILRCQLAITLSWRAQTCVAWSWHTLLAHYLWEVSLVHQVLTSLDEGSSFCHQCRTNALWN